MPNDGAERPGTVRGSSPDQAASTCPLSTASRPGEPHRTAQRWSSVRLRPREPVASTGCLTALLTESALERRAEVDRSTTERNRGYWTDKGMDKTARQRGWRTSAGGHSGPCQGRYWRRQSQPLACVVAWQVAVERRPLTGMNRPGFRISLASRSAKRFVGGPNTNEQILIAMSTHTHTSGSHTAVVTSWSQTRRDRPVQGPSKRTAGWPETHPEQPVRN